MGLFSKVDVHTLEENTSVSDRTVLVSVTDRDPGVLRFGGGVNSERDFSVKAFSNLSYNNLGGSARALSGRVELGDNVAHVNYLESDISAGYLEPFLFDSLTRGRVNITRSQHVFEYSQDADFTQITLSNILTFNLEHDFNRHFRGTWRVWQYEEREDYEINGHCLTGDTTQYCPPDLLYVNTLGPTLDIDYRDNVFNPSKGSLTTISAEYADPFLGSSNGVWFLRSEIKESFYIPLKKDSKRWVWANQERFGYLTNFSSAFNSGVPVSHAFFLGGIDTVRGFDYSEDNERIPPGNLMPVIEGNQLLVKSDSFYYMLKTELRFPIVGEHGGVIFYDGGAVYVSGYNFPRPYRDSIGIGYRYNTPVGPVSLDIAFKINPIENQTTQVFEAPYRIHFSIGSF